MIRVKIGFKKVNSSTKIYYEDVRNLNKIKKIIKKLIQILFFILLHNP